ncbi:MAG: hypothetical protein ACR2N4_18550 [Jatrophihabitans sp.]
MTTPATPPTMQSRPPSEGVEAGGTPGDEPGTLDLAKDQAGSLAHDAADAGQHVTGVAKDQTKAVVAEAGGQARDLLDQARGELGEQAGQQQQRLASGLRALGDELHSMAHHADQPGIASDLAGQAASKSHDVASWLEDREPGHVVDELKGFARQRTGTFLLAALGAGLLAGRLTRGLKDTTGEDSSRAGIEPAPAARPAFPVGTAEPGHDAEPQVSLPLTGAVLPDHSLPDYPLLGEQR